MRPQLLLTYDFPPMGGGIARWMGELARRYPQGSLVVSTGQLPGSDEVDERLPNRVDRVSVPVRRLKTLQGVLAWSRQVSVLTRTLNPEFIWCGTLKPAAYPAKWVRERVGTPFGVIAHGNDFLILRHQTHRSMIKRRVAKGLLDAASVVVANSHWTRDLCLSVLGELGVSLSEDRVRVVPLGTDPEFFRPGVDPSGVREKYDLEPGRWLLSVTRLVPYKGVDTVLQALATLGAEFADLRYAVVGSGEGLTELKALARKLGVAQRVRFLTDVPDADLPALYNLAAAYVGLSRQAGLDVEGFGISFAEASACGKPVVAARSGGIPDVVADGETGILVDAERPEEVVEALRRVLRDDKLAARLGREGRARVERFQNWDRVTRDLRAIAQEFAGDVARSG
jgi:phosphatidylinositol alpha-1,6-mannosyltransferase